MRRIGILTSGGDAPGMNACIRAAVRSALYYDMQIVGVERGYEGLIEGTFREMDLSSVGDILHRGGTILKTARSERFRTQEGIEEAVRNLEKAGVEGLITCGGDGTYRGANDLMKAGFPVVGVPATIDNDMGYTDFTIGFDTAVNTVLDAISLIRDTSSSHERTTIIEVMGRECGDIALYSGLAGGADAILIPELEFSLGELTDKLAKGMERGKNPSIIIKAEGVDIETEELQDKLSDLTGLNIRSVKLAYLQRGGSPTANDRMLATLTANRAAKCLSEDRSGVAIGMTNGQIVETPLKDAIGVKREVNLDLLPLIDM
ncbi:MAG: 6-phosphofructokinase, partial [Firmicutes bacterium]|nr:6-phosphofructokinase [Bacillota bacterium]